LSILNFVDESFTTNNFSGGGGPFPFRIFTQKTERFLQIAPLFRYGNMFLII
jgi:hypothetical protein